VTPIKPIFTPVLLHDRVGVEHELARVGVHDVGRYVREVRIRYLAQQRLLALVELVVAQGPHLEPNEVHRLDGRLVVEVGRYQRGAPDHVAGVHPDRAVRVRLLVAMEVGVEVGRAPGRRPPPNAGVDRLQVAVEVVDGEELYLGLVSC